MRGTVWIDILILAAGIWLLLFVLRFRMVLSIQFPEVQARLLRRPLAPPEGSRDLFENAERELSELGFGHPTWVLCEYRPASAQPTLLKAVCRHEHEPVLVWVGPPVDLNRPNTLLIYLTTRLEDGRWAVTQVRDPYFEAVADDETPAQTIEAGSFAECLEKHRAWLGALGGEPDRGTGLDRSIREFASSWQMDIRRRLIEAGRLHLHEGVAYPSFRFGWELLRRITKLSKAPKSTRPVPSARLALLGGRQELTQRRGPSPVHDRALFWISAALFLGLGTPLFGFEFSAMLLGVIAFHEYGHWLAMRAFGYHNPQITLLPLLGGVTIGHENHPDATRRAWVSLAGPLPGIILGWSLLIWSFLGGEPLASSVPWLGSLAAILLAVNYLNVLPIPPLDGSHVVRALLPARWLVLQTGMVLLGIGLAIALGWLFDLWIIALLAGLQLFLLPGMIQTQRAIRRLSDRLPGGDRPLLLRLRAVLDALEAQDGPASNATQRLNQAREIVTVLSTRPMSWFQRGLVGLVFSALLVVPLAGLLVFSGLFSLFQAGPEIDFEAAMAREAERREQLEQQVETLPLPRLIGDLHGARPLPEPAAESARPESDLGPLSPSLRAVYAVANGLPELGLWPVERIRRAANHPEAVEFLGYGSYQGKYLFYPEDDYDHPVEVPEAAALDWWVIGTADEDQRMLFWVPDGAAGQGRYHLIDYGYESSTLHRDAATWLRQLWVNEKSIAAALAEEEKRRARVRESLRDATLEELLAAFPRPSLFDRWVLKMPAWPGPADDAALSGLEARVGAPLMPLHEALLRRHDGFPPLSLLSVDAIHRFERERHDYLEVEQTLEPAPGLESAGEPGLELQQLQHCWVLAGYGEPGQVSASLLWCPAGRPATLVDLGWQRYHADFEGYLREAVVQTRSVY